MYHGDIESSDRNGLQTKVEELMAEAKALLIAEGLLDEMVLEDRSKGVHNPQFSKKLLETAIDALE